MGKFDIPKTARSAYGQEFCPLDDTWTIHTFGTNQRLHFASLRQTAGPFFCYAIRRVFVVLAQTRNTNTCQAALTRVRTTAAAWKEYSGQRIEEISPEALVVALRAGIPLELWRTILRIWVLQDENNPKVAEALEFATNALTARRRGGKHLGASVLTWDPVDGPYRPEEDEAIRVALDDAFNTGAVSAKEFTLMRMFRGVGMRPVQLSAMKVCDVQKRNGQYRLRVPMAKQRGIKERDLFMPWKPITQGLGLLLDEHIHAYVVPRLVEGADLLQAPLFPKGRGKIEDEGMEYHIRPDVLRKVYVRVFERLQVRSPITGSIMIGTTRRERHTHLTMLAMAGCTKEQIAANAGHSNPNSCQFYIEASTDHFQRMETIVGAAFVAVADRFMGRIIASEDDEQAQRDSDSILHDSEMTSLGSCAVGGCGAIEAGVAPIACYTCRKFRAWEDAPHALLLDQIEQERERLIANGHSSVAQTKTATIVAITDLMQAIHEKKAGKADV